MQNRPGPDECAPFYQKYIDELPASHILSLLQSQRAEAVALFRSLDKARARHRYAPGKWSVQEICGHLIDTERLFGYRAMCFARGDAGPLPAMDENAYVANAAFDDRDLANLVDEYEHVRGATIGFFRGLPEETGMRRGTASGCEFTVRVFPYIIAGHERHHLNVIKSKYLP